MNSHRRSHLRDGKVSAQQPCRSVDPPGPCAKEQPTVKNTRRHAGQHIQAALDRTRPSGALRESLKSLRLQHACHSRESVSKTHKCPSASWFCTVSDGRLPIEDVGLGQSCNSTGASPVSTSINLHTRSMTGNAARMRKMMDASLTAGKRVLVGGQGWGVAVGVGLQCSIAFVSEEKQQSAWQNTQLCVRPLCSA